MQQIAVIDNYDSFVYNLVHYIEEFAAKVDVFRNDQVQIEQLEKYDKILLSPGPGIPEEAGLLKDIIRHYAGKTPLLGVCLGQQAIMEVYGGKLLNLKKVYHGVATQIEVIVDDEILFKDLPKQLEVGRYHSWVINPDIPDCLAITSYDENQQIMSIRHREFDVRAVQFHPESVLTPDGKKMIQNWVES
ncbi:anthranilate synthase component II [Psychroflexus planctonicus]|uniref:Aminodeoxychorismate/anthranilate synthase component II n=1 Tax=Psychroflexus planctonicus TaxID=1526575 RepID=A0ABQ1SIW5_9FLAO|nr:aminodeoxychorismate/anthranilate synthase component II [Psychroflexus planctonicus]GGE36721.1 aminodeoxychorismate/anthranilate synthase component II [Psychroflexus planctonicus]